MTEDSRWVERDCSGGLALTPLMKAARVGNCQLIAQTLEAGGARQYLDGVDGQGHTALMIACSLGHADVARALLKAGCDIDVCNADGQDAEAIALAAGHAECAEHVRKTKQSVAALYAAIVPDASASTSEQESFMSKMLREAGSSEGGAKECPF